MTTPHYSDSNAITRCVAALGFRFTDRDAERLGVNPRHLDAAVIYGIAKIEKITTNPVSHQPVSAHRDKVVRAATAADQARRELELARKRVQWCESHLTTKIEHFERVIAEGSKT